MAPQNARTLTNIKHLRQFNDISWELTVYKTQLDQYFVINNIQSDDIKL